MPFELSVDITRVAQVMFYILLFFFSVYALFLGYHWFTFGTSKQTSTIALAIYLLGGAVLFLTLASSIRLL